MNPASVIERARALGVELYVEGGRLNGRGAKPTPEMLGFLRENESAIVAFLTQAELHAGGGNVPAGYRSWRDFHETVASMRAHIAAHKTNWINDDAA